MNKVFAFLAAALLLAACNPNASAPEPNWPQSEIIQNDLGFGKIYGVKVLDYSPEATAKGYAIQLSLGDKVWLDTLYADIGAQDTVSSEIYFSEAPDTSKLKPTHRVTAFDAQ
jgi:hypothetical protein